MECLYQCYLNGSVLSFTSEPFGKIASLVTSLKTVKDEHERIRLFLEIYDYVSRMEGTYHPRYFMFLGTIKPENVSLILRARKNERRNRLETIITRIVDMPDVEIDTLLRKGTGEVVPADQQPGQDTAFFEIKGKLFQLDRESRELIQESAIFSDGILLDGSSVTDAKAIISIKNLLNSEEIADVQGGVQYDEWDFRRSDYKKGWCHLCEQDIPHGDEPFVEMTLRRYGGYVKTLRRKFELLKKELKLLRRQKEGDDVDIDAIIEAFTDMRAGLSPSQDLFVKLDRRARNIAALFLLDMSGSTKGWINRAEKESLVLMCEALEALGDRYSIYGFSGITRTKNDYYRIKNFSESYSPEVRKRIAGIVPQDYTRMGPPIRHATRILNEVDARTKLLITLSDGHPEDRDGYRGEYGIEDTRKALIEAKQKGIQPFCITIDKEASTYLPHMFGEVSYVVLDDVRKLPNKITEIYRKLTT
jgi:nitric oxide reductase NorD protein